jgi:hypothetical protein
MKTDMDGNQCGFNKVIKAKRARQKDGIEWKIYCKS